MRPSMRPSGTPPANARPEITGSPATDVRFATPGTYVLRAIAFDRLFEAWHDMAVTVTQ